MSLILSAWLEAERLWKRGARAVRNAEPAKIGSIAVEAALRAIGAANVPGPGVGVLSALSDKEVGVVQPQYAG